MNEKIIRYDVTYTGMAGLAAIAWIVLCVTILVGFDGQPDRASFLLFLLFSYSSFKLWQTIFDRQVSPLMLMFWLFHANFLFLPALSQSVHRIFFWSSYEAYTQESLLFAGIIVIAGLSAFAVGNWLGRNRSRELPRTVRENNFLVQPLMATWRVQFFLMFILACLVVFVLYIGPEVFMRVRQERALISANQTQNGFMVNLPRAAAIGVLMLSTYFLVQAKRAGRKSQLPLLVIFSTALVLNAIINYPLALARFWFFGLLISLIWIVMPLQTVKLRAGFVVGISALQFTLLPWFSQITRGSGLLGFDMQSIRSYLHHGDFDGFQSIVNNLIYIQQHGYEYGRSLLSVVLFFVPRSIWNKADPLGAAAARHMGYDFTNLSAPIYGELYIDFGLLSLLLGMAFIGYGMRLLDGYYNILIQRGRLGAGVLFTAVLAGYLIILLRGSLLAIISSIATLFALLIFSSWLASRSAAPGRLFTTRLYH